MSNNNGQEAEKPLKTVPKFASFKPPSKTPKATGRNLAASESKQHQTQQQARGNAKKDNSRSASPDGDREHHHSKHSWNKERERERERKRHEQLRGSKHKLHERLRRSKSSDSKSYLNQAKEPPAPAVSPQSRILSYDDDSSSGNLNWAFDRKGDPANITYGTIHRYSIPTYYRIGQGRIIGLPADTRIQEDKGDGKGLVLISRDHSGESYRKTTAGERSYRLSLNTASKSFKTIKRSAKDSFCEEFKKESEFIPLTRGKKRKRAESEDSGDEKKGSVAQSLAELIHPTAASTHTRLEDEDLGYGSSTSGEDEMAKWESSAVRQKGVELQRKVDSNTSDIDAWLQLVAHQDVILYLDEERRRVTDAEKRSTGEIKLSIIEKALNKAELDLEGKERLLEAYFDVARSIWEPKKLLSRYKTTLKQNPNMHKIWAQYLNFRQTDFDSFNYKDMVNCYDDCLEILRSSVFRRLDNEEERILLENAAVYVILRGLKFVLEAGFTEIAVGAIQALLELNICPPKSLSGVYPPNSKETYDTIIDELGKFWESEAIRIGEPGSEGWDKFVENGSSGIIPYSSTKDNVSCSPVTDFNDPLGHWVERETFFGKNTWPARTVDCVEEEDPHRVVLFKDIRSWMFIFLNESSITKLLDGIIQLCGLPSWIFANHSTLEDWSRGKDTLLADTVYLGKMDWFWPRKDAEPNMITWEGMEPERRSGLGDDVFGFKLPGGFPFTEDMLFSRECAEWAIPLMEVNEFHELKLVRGLLIALLERSLFNPELENRIALFWLAIEWRQNPKGSKKIAKSLLKEFRQSLILWNAYAQIEWRDSNPDVAKNVFSTALNMSKSFPDYQRRDAILLSKTWAWEEILDGNYVMALRVLLSIPDGFGEIRGEMNRTAMLKARRHIQDEQARHLSIGQPYHAFLYNEALALIEYLSPIVDTPSRPTFDPSIAIPIYESFLFDMKERGLSGRLEYEIALTNGKVRLLYHHCRASKLFRISLLREALEQGISEAWEARRVGNSLLWSLYVWNEGRRRIEGRLRLWLREKILGVGDQNATPMGWKFWIWAESRMAGENTHAIRKLFERAVKNENTRASVSLWKLYVEFELQHSNTERAKNTFFRALKSCPWSKDIAMFSFKHLFSALSSEELRKVLSIVSAEKELRLHDTFELENTLEKIEEAELRRIYPGIDTAEPKEPKEVGLGKLTSSQRLADD